MKECGICNDKTTIYKCSQCSIEFCDKCGDPVEMLCEYCLEEDEI
jgi:hypothetical protein